MKIGKTLYHGVDPAGVGCTAGATSGTQSGTDQEAKNAPQARQALDRMVQALGGQAWLDIKNQLREGFIAAFFHNQPNPGTTQFWEFHEWPDHDRIELTKHRDVAVVLRWSRRLGSDLPRQKSNAEDRWTTFFAAATTPLKRL